MEIAAAPLAKRQRLALFFALLKEKNAVFSECKAAYMHISECLEQVECEHAGRTFTEFMFMASFSDFVFYKRQRIYVWETTAHAIVIHDSGAYGIYPLKQPKSIFDCLKGIPFDECFYQNTVPLALFASASGKELWKRKAPE